MFDAVVTAGGRLSPSDAQRFGTDVKALVCVGGRTLLDIVVSALRSVPDIARVVVVGPSRARPGTCDVDEWIDECPSGEENLLAALRAGRTERLVFSASDLPFVTPSSYAGLVARTPDGVDVAYPIYGRDEFLKTYPGGRGRFAKLADGEWTGGSALVVNRLKLLRDTRFIERSFGARKSLASLASLLGPALLLKYVLGRARVEDVEARASLLLGAEVRSVRGADPAIAMDCDDADDLAYAGAQRRA